MTELTLDLAARVAQSGEVEALWTPQRAYRWRELGEAIEAHPIEAVPFSVCSEPNSPQAVVHILACLSRQIPLLLLHPRLSPRERATQLSFVQEHQAQLPADTAVILFTSGTSGRAKAACLSRAAMLASARATFDRLGDNLMRRWLLALPLCHVGGLSIVTRALAIGGVIVMPDDTSNEGLMACASTTELTGASLVPTQLARLLERGASLQRFGVIVLGGAPAPAPLLARARAVGARVLCTYGMTETASQIALERLDDADGRSSGVVFDGVQIEIRDSEGEPAPRGVVGQLWVEGPSLFLGYLGHEPRRGAFDTGDLGFLDELGRLHIESRRTDLIISGGENVYPLEVERVLVEHPAVAAALVFGAEHPEWGQEVRALLVLNASRAREAELIVELGAYLRERLARYKWPRKIGLVTALPLTPLGKPDRNAARLVEGLRDFTG